MTKVIALVTLVVGAAEVVLDMTTVVVEPHYHLDTQVVESVGVGEAENTC